MYLSKSSHSDTRKCTHTTDSHGEAPVWNTEPMLLTWKPLHRLRCDISLFCLLLFPYSLPLSYPLSSAEPIFWHFRRCSSHACHISPPPPVLSSWPSIESTHLCLKVMYFVELTLWCLHHLEVGKWYWVGRLIFMVESEKSSKTFCVHAAQRTGKHCTLEGGGGWGGGRGVPVSPLNLHSLTIFNSRPWRSWRLETSIYPPSVSQHALLRFLFSHLYPLMYEATAKSLHLHIFIVQNCTCKDCEQQEQE